MSNITRASLASRLSEWYQAWNDHDLDAVFDFLHDDIVFENWDGAVVKGKKSLRRAWRPWFKNHGGFNFIELETFIELERQKALFH